MAFKKLIDVCGQGLLHKFCLLTLCDMVAVFFLLCVSNTPWGFEPQWGQGIPKCKVV